MNSNIFLCSSKSLVSIPFVVEQSTLAAAVGKSVSQPEPTHEFSWGVEGGLVELSKYSDSEMVVDVPENAADSIQSIVQRLLQQKSKLKYLSESELIRLLKMAVRYKSKFKKNEKLNSKESDIIFSFVFSSSFSDVFLIKYLEHISLEETLLILKLMLLYLNNKFEYPPDVLWKPTNLQILNWTHLVIQSHIDSLLLLKDKKSIKLLQKLNKAVAQKMEEYETAAGIQSYFFLLNKKIVPEKSAVSRYCTETLDV